MNSKIARRCRLVEIAMRTKSIYLLACCMISCSLAKPTAVFLGYQDSLGQYSFGYSAPGSARSEVRILNGATRGAYSYVDESGVIQTAEYVADGENGFRVVATNLPQAPLPVQDTEEVAAARAAHLQAVEMARKAEESMVNTESKSTEKSETRREGDAEGTAKEETLQQIEPKSVKANELQEKEEKVTEQSNANANVNRKNVVEVPAPKSSQDVSGAHLAIPVISPHVVLPQILSPSLVPVFRVSQGFHEIEPSANEISAKSSDSSNTPAGTALSSDQESSVKITTKEAAKTEEKEPKTEEKIEEKKAIITPLNIYPLSTYSSFIGYSSPPALHYITYDIL